MAFVKFLLETYLFNIETIIRNCKTDENIKNWISKQTKLINSVWNWYSNYTKYITNNYLRNSIRNGCALVVAYYLLKKIVYLIFIVNLYMSKSKMYNSYLGYYILNYF